MPIVQTKMIIILFWQLRIWWTVVPFLRNATMAMPSIANISKVDGDGECTGSRARNEPSSARLGVAR